MITPTDAHRALFGPRVAAVARWLPLAILALGACATVAGWRALRVASQQQLMREVDAQSAAVAHEISARLDARVRAMRRMAARWASGGQPGESLWRADARRHVEDLVGHRAIEWVDADGRVAWVEPVAENAAAIGLDLGREPLRRAAMDEARASGLPRATPPTTLAQGGSGVLVFFPLVVGERFDGWLLAVWDHRRLLESVLRTEAAADFDVGVTSAGTVVFGRGDASERTDAAWTRTVAIDVPPVAWTARVSLPPAAVDRRMSHSPEWIALGGLWLTILLAVAVSAAQRAARRKQALEIGHRREVQALEERARAEAALAASELRFRHVVEHLGAVFWIWSLDRQTLEYVSPGYEAIWGRPRAELYADPQGWIDTVVPEDRLWAAIDVVAGAVDRGAVSDDRRYRIRRPDGTLRWIRDRAFVIRDEHGMVRHVAGLAEDVTELHEREDAVRAAREELEVLVRAQPDVILRLAEDGTVQEVRAGHGAGLRYAPGAMTGRRFRDTVPPDAAAAIDDALPRIRDGASIATVEYALPLPDRLRRFEARFVALPKREVLALVRDCTERHAAETMLRGEAEIFAMVARHAPLAASLAECCLLIERLCTGTRASILLRDAAAGVLRHGAAPSLSATFVAALDGFPIAAGAGACGAAAHDKVPVLIDDVLADPRTAPYRELAASEGIGAVWSHPLMDRAGEVLGTFAVYHRERGLPLATDVAVIERIRDLATIAIVITRGAQALRLTQFAVDNVADFVFQIDSDGRFVDVNPAACRRLGYTRAELVGRALGDIDPDYGASVWPQKWEFLKRVRQWRIESSHVTRDGEVYPVDVTATYVEHEGRSYSYAIVRDITEWKRSVAAVEESEERLRLAAEAGQMGIWDWRMDTGQFEHTATMRRLFGIAGEDATAAECRGAVHPDDQDRVRAGLVAARRGERVDDLEFRVVWPDGSVHWRSSHCRVYRDAEGRGARMVGIVIDIEQRKRAEHERESLLAEVRTANGMLSRLSRQLLDVQEKERRDLSRDLHDEVGQCIAAAKINVDLLCRRFPAVVDDPSIEDTVALLDHIMQHVSRLCLELRPSVLDDLGLGAALRWYVHRQAKRSGWTATTEIDELPKLGDTVQGVCFRTVQKALTNVMRHAQAKAVAVELRRRGDVLVLRISDDGVGFDAAGRGPRAWGSGGLGLLGMRERLYGVGGSFVIESAPGRGTRIEACMPLEVPLGEELAAPVERASA